MIITPAIRQFRRHPCLAVGARDIGLEVPFNNWYVTTRLNGHSYPRSYMVSKRLPLLVVAHWFYGPAQQSGLMLGFIGHRSNERVSGFLVMHRGAPTLDSQGK